MPDRHMLTNRTWSVQHQRARGLCTCGRAFEVNVHFPSAATAREYGNHRILELFDAHRTGATGDDTKTALAQHPHDPTCPACLRPLSEHRPGIYDCPPTTGDDRP